MHVISLRSDFSKKLARLIQAGGSAGIAGRKAQQIIGDLSTGGDCSQYQTNYGEGRIKHCIKYDLPSAYRLITLQPIPELVVTCFVGTHEEAEHWLDQNRGLMLVVDPASHRIEIVMSERPMPAFLPPALNLAPKARTFRHDLPEEILKQLLPSAALRRALEALTTDAEDEAILEFCGTVAEDLGDSRGTAVCDILIFLRDGQLEQARVRAEVEVGRFSEVSPANPIGETEIRAPVNSEHVLVLSDLTDNDWANLCDRKKFQDWMIWLHPEQKLVAQAEHPGPVALDGVSGSGKTCVLVHRARWLARKYPSERILVVTLNRSLASLIERLCCRLCTDEEKAQIEVCSFHQYLSGLLGFVGLGQIAEAMREPLDLGNEVSEMVAAHGVMNPTGLFRHRDEVATQEFWKNFTTAADSGSQRAQERFRAFLMENTDQPELDASRYLHEELSIVQSVGLLSDNFFGEYLEHDRSGRSIRLDQAQRKNIQGILRTWLKFQLRHGQVDEPWLSQAALLALKLTKNIPSEYRFRSVLVDEYQDFSSLEIDLLRQIPSAIPNGLFLTGDQAQRIHTKHLDLNRAKLSTIERRRIRKNYRNSRQILEAGQALLEKYCSVSSAIDAGVKVLPPEYAARNSARPFACRTDDTVSCAWAHVVEWVAGGNPPFTACIITASPQHISPEQIMVAAPAGLTSSQLTGDYVFDSEAVVVSDITAVKGFEFSLVIIVGLDEDAFPRRGAAKNELWRDALRLYVAITRARDELCLIHEGEPSEFLTAMATFLQSRETLYGGKTLDKQSTSDSPQPTPEATEPRPEKRERPAVPIPPPWLPKIAADSPDVHPLGPSESTISRPKEDKHFEREAEPQSSTPLRGRTNSIHDGKPDGESDLLTKPTPKAVEQGEVRELNGYNLISTPNPCTQMTLCRLLNLDHTKLQLACYDMGLHLTPFEPIQPQYVKKLMLKFDCVPVFSLASGTSA